MSEGRAGDGRVRCVLGGARKKKALEKFRNVQVRALYSGIVKSTCYLRAWVKSTFSSECARVTLLIMISALFSKFTVEETIKRDTEY